MNETRPEFGMRISYRDATLIPEGHLDVESVRAFMDAAKALIAAADQPIVVDLASVGFLDSSGLGALIAAKNVAEMKGLELTLRNMPARIRRLIRMTGLSEVFPSA